MPFATVPERKLLETVLSECKCQLDREREAGNTLAADLIEADLNATLERLSDFYSQGNADGSSDTV